MFDDHQADQTHNTDNGTVDTGVPATPTMGIGMNPNPTYVPPASDATAPTVVLPTPGAASSSSATSGATDHPATVPAATGELEEIKRNALAQLSPLVGKLEQTPEEKYKTIMMMIQASDNQGLIGEAYETAQKITDEKIKAEALLNIVNEINYFAQKNQG